MATLKGIGYNTTTAKTSTGASTDTVDFDTNVEISGDLSVLGDIQSRSTSSLLIQDNFIDLNQGNDSATSLPGGYTLQVAKAAGFTTAKTITAFTAAVAYSSGTAGGSLSVDTMPANGESITLQSKCIKGNATQTISFVNSGGTETTFGASTGNTLKIDITASTTITAIAAAIKTGFDNSLRTQKGLTLFNAAVLSGTDNKVVTFTPSIGNLAIANINLTDVTGGNIAVTDGNSDGDPAFFTSSTGTAVVTGDIIDVHTSDDATNDGLYGIAALDGNNHYIVPTVGINDSVKFLKSTFVASTESTTNCKAYVPSLYVQIIASGDAAIKDAAGTIAEGTLADQFDATADFASFSTYTVVGAGTTTLQDAYNAGQTIETNNSNAFAITLTDGAMTVSTTNGENFSTQGAGNSNITTTGGTVQLTSTNSAAGTVTLQTNGGTAETILLQNQQGNTNAAIDINAVAGGVDIDAQTMVTIDAVTDISLTARGNLNLDLNPAGLGKAKYAMMSLKASEALTDGNIVKLVAPTVAQGSLEVTNRANLVDNSSTITLTKADNATVVFTAKASGATGNQFNIGADNATTATNIANAINANSDFTAVVDGGTDTQVNISLVTFGTSGNTKAILTNQATAIGNIVAFTGANDTRIAKAQADVIADAIVFGIVDAAVSINNNGIVYGEGSYITAAGLSFTGAQVGSVCYLSTTAGGVTVTPPNSSGDTVFEVGLVVDTNAIIFRPRFVMEVG